MVVQNQVARREGGALEVKLGNGTQRQELNDKGERQSGQQGRQESLGIKLKSRRVFTQIRNTSSDVPTIQI